MDRALLAALASPRRREILRLLWDGEQSVGVIHQAMPDVTLGAVSLQLKALLDAGLVEARAEHKNRYYAVCRDRLQPLAAMLEAMWNDALWALKLAAELEETRRGPRPLMPKAPQRARLAVAATPRRRTSRRRTEER
jgi:DNA-binding transcriptional ArsR family regulator